MAHGGGWGEGTENGGVAKGADQQQKSEARRSTAEGARPCPHGLKPTAARCRTTGATGRDATRESTAGGRAGGKGKEGRGGLTRWPPPSMTVTDLKRPCAASAMSAVRFDMGLSKERSWVSLH